MSDVASPMQVLLIDDTSFARDVMAEMLLEAKSSAQLSWKPDYDTGLAALKSNAFDVCLLDYQLGDRDGLELLREARAGGTHTPVILLTGHSSPELDREAMRAGASDYLVKGDFTSATFERIMRYLVERTRAERALRDSEERYALAMEGSNDGLWDWRVDARTLHLSTRWKRMLGFEPHELGDSLSTWFERVHEDDRKRLEHDFTRHLVAGETPHFESEHRLQHKDGSWRHVLARGKAVRDPQGRGARMVGSLTDVTMARSRDPLTGLANRVLFLDRVEFAFHRLARDPSHQFAVLFIDLDRFKNVNDSLGHEAGDELLVSIARRLELCVRVVDTVARLGGDEFVVLLDSSREPDGPTRVAKRICDELARPFRVRGRDLFTGASIGIAMSSPQYQTTGDLLRDADTAMYRAKGEGRGRFVVFDTAMHKRAMHVLSVESELRRALEKEELEVFYQPVISLETHQPLGFEALARWRHPTQGMVPPGDFIPVAEDSDLVVLIDLHVLRMAARQVAAWRARFGELHIAVNASRRHFSRQGYAAAVEQAAKDAGIAPSVLRVEVTESLTMELPLQARLQLEELDALGVKLYVDDFGVGYSALSTLHTYPFSGLKLDRTFVAGLGNADGPTDEVVKAIFAIAQALKLDVVAEGVETQGQHQVLQAMGCTRGQGFLYARPMSVDDATTWLTTRPGT